MLRYVTCGSLLQGPINIATNPSCALGDRKLMVKRCSRIISFVVSAYLDHIPETGNIALGYQILRTASLTSKGLVSYVAVSIRNNIVGYLTVILDFRFIFFIIHFLFAKLCVVKCSLLVL